MAVNSLERGPWANWVTGPALKRMRIGDEGYDPGEGISVECGGVSGQCRLRDGVSLTPTNKKPLRRLLIITTRISKIVVVFLILERFQEVFALHRVVLLCVDGPRSMPGFHDSCVTA